MSFFIDNDNTKSQKMVQNINFPTQWPFGAQRVSLGWAAGAFPSILSFPRSTALLSPAAPFTVARPSWMQRGHGAPELPVGICGSSSFPWPWLFSEGGMVSCSSEQWISNTNRYPWCSSGQPCRADWRSTPPKSLSKTFPNTDEEEKEPCRWEKISFSYISTFVCVLICTHYTCMHIYICMCICT